VASGDRGASKKWPRFAKGGDFSRFYSDVYLVVRWDAEAHDEYKKRLSNFNVLLTSNSPMYLYRRGLTWPERTAKGLNVRYLPSGCIFSQKGPALFFSDEASEDYILGVSNSLIFEYLFRTKTSFSWEIGAMKSLPVPLLSQDQTLKIGSLARSLAEVKERWSLCSELATGFVRPWILACDLVDHSSIPKRLQKLADYEFAQDELLRKLYGDLNDSVYAAYGINKETRTVIEATIGARPPELIWPQMEGKNADQKRMEHVWRLLSYIVKSIMEADGDGIVALFRVSDSIPLIDRVHDELAKLFPEQDINAVEGEIANELKRKVKGYDRTENIREWLENSYFAYHVSMYKSRPIFWHVASSQGKKAAAFSALVHYHRFDKERMAMLRATHLRGAIGVFRREAALARQEGRTDDHLEWQAKLEEVEELDKRLQRVQEGFHTGSEDYRILTPWKTDAERPQGWNPDMNDGVKVNIEPLQRAAVLRISEVV
jgi:hypothetical protein